MEIGKSNTGNVRWAILEYSSGHDFNEVIKWCLANIEKGYGDCVSYSGRPFSYEKHFTYAYFTFERERDAMWFALRWS